MKSAVFRKCLGFYASALFLFLYLPLVPLAAFSFNTSRVAVWSGFTLHWYRRALADPLLIESTINSLVIALAATAIATAVGTLGAYALWKQRSAFLMQLLYLSLVVPDIVTGISMLVFFQFLFRFFSWRLGMHTVVLAHVGFSLAYSLTVVLARLRTMDSSLEEAAVDLGATPWQAFRYVTLPLLLPAVGAAALLCFTVSFDDYVITSMVAGVDSETLPMVIYAMARKGVNPEVNAISVLISICLGGLVLVASRWQQDPHAHQR